jgi:hypothetical protein
MENKKMFMYFGFIKSMLCNRLITHLPLVHMFAQQFYILNISHMKNALSNGEWHHFDIVMMHAL